MDTSITRIICDNLQHFRLNCSESCVNGLETQNDQSKNGESIETGWQFPVDNEFEGISGRFLQQLILNCCTFVTISMKWSEPNLHQSTVRSSSNCTKSNITVFIVRHYHFVIRHLKFVILDRINYFKTAQNSASQLRVADHNLKRLKLYSILTELSIPGLFRTLLKIGQQKNLIQLSMMI